MAKMMLTCREASERDVPDVMAIETASFTDPWLEGTIYRSVTGENAKTYVAEESGWIVGFAMVSVSFETADLTNFAVHPVSRNRGIAKELLAYTLSKLAFLGAGQVLLEVRASNEPAIALYKKFGFEPISVRRKYYDSPVEDAIIMKANII